MDHQMGASVRMGVDMPQMNRLLDEELGAFLRNFGARPVPEEQDLRSLLVAWVAVFLPEAIPGAFRRRLETEVRSLCARKDFRTQGWYEALPLELALFALTGECAWLDTHRYNVDHHNASLRVVVLQSLALAADRLDFTDPELQARAAHILEAHYLYGDWCFVLLAVARGEPELKRRHFESWLEQYDMNPWDRAALEALSRGEQVPNPFLGHFLWLHQYLCLRLIEEVPGPPAQIALPGLQITEGSLQRRPRLRPDVARSPVRIGEPALGAVLWQRLRSHPLMASHVSLKGGQRLGSGP